MIPWLLIHGSEDKIVPVTDSSSLLLNFEETRHLVELPNADHFFSGETVSQVSRIIIDWLGKKIQPI
jgi:pimeloyl-ACP methyl ester carboxylesterase